MAGFFDGEGNIQLYLRAPSSSNRYGQYILITSVTNTNPSSLDLFTGFGGRRFQASKATNEHKASYRWEATGSVAKRFLEVISPYLKLKKEVARLAIEFQTCIENWKRFGRVRLSTTEIRKRDALIAQFRCIQPSDGRGRKRRNYAKKTATNRTGNII